MHAQTGGLGHGSDEGAGAALAVGAGDVDDRRQAPLGMIQPGKQGTKPVEAEIDQPGMQPLEAGERSVRLASFTPPPAAPAGSAGR